VRACASVPSVSSIALPDLDTKDFPADPAQRHELANVWTRRGIALLSSNEAAALPEALKCFETAIVLRRDLPLEENAWFRWGLTAGWMNRGDVLTRLGESPQLVEALYCYDEAIAHLEKLPPQAEMNVPGRQALAWLNRAVTLRAQKTAKSLQEALHSLDRAKSVLKTAVTQSQAVDAMTLATLEVNRAGVLLEMTPPQALAVLDAAGEALQFCHPLETQDELAAELGLKARHAFCLAVALLLETPPVDTAQADDWIMCATDLVEEAMSLSAAWEGRGAEFFPQLRHELFRYGCRMYLAYQPQFMAEFLLDVLDPERGSPLRSGAKDLHEAGREALSMAAEVLKRRGPLDLGLQGMDRLLELLKTLNQAAERIKNLAD
jgi:tetratricopeptide (TPR) repeat protein